DIPTDNPCLLHLGRRKDRILLLAKNVLLELSSLVFVHHTPNVAKNNHHNGQNEGNVLLYVRHVLLVYSLFLPYNGVSIYGSLLLLLSLRVRSTEPITLIFFRSLSWLFL